jgi:hypothetical protein
MKALNRLLLFLLAVPVAGNLTPTNATAPFSVGSGDLEDTAGANFVEQEDLEREMNRELQRGCSSFNGDPCLYDYHCCGGGTCLWSRNLRGGGRYGVCRGGVGTAGGYYYGVNNYNYYGNDYYGLQNQGTCRHDGHCPRGFYCNWRQGGSSYGICQRANLGVNVYDYYNNNNYGSFCTRDSHCPRGFYCHWHRGRGLYSSYGTCTRGGTQGGFTSLGGTCFRTADCAPGMHCRSNFCT